MKGIFILLSLLATVVTFCFYFLALMDLQPLVISGPLFFLSILVTIRLITYRKKRSI
ncbi:hypothetical protein JOD43_000757 [Pullulanibacillus pueri]|uniref:Uncharacterized protein n=1 Tax=Pullulanibacillus pueri TaxID=1437324 RepID=A0A8J2ZXD7_9BACL|nr:hypothetical protein [Pullulanibacillus pueri]MBM7680595.1 hypothetical protein [Pullulanibacillus pueri]GGH83989.1 hypothetical protein GCM10007096_26030 [Pullulanibacillus pueri]